MQENKSITNFLNEDYRNFAMYVIENRAIPSVIDGFKPTQRKVIFVANKVWKTGKEKSLKVFQLTGKVASDAYYHHGDGSLNNAIIGMAQDFKNSMPLLKPLGQFGSLRAPESGAPRYISTSLSNNFRLLYKDFELLDKKFEEGFEIEPDYFLPIIPTVIINGSSGIAVGFATNILNRNPIDVIEACIDGINDRKIKDLKPWINGFKGTFIRDPEKIERWKISGIYVVENTSTIRVTELPPSMTYEKYEDYLNKLIDKKIISSYDDNSVKDVNFLIKFRRADLAGIIKRQALETTLKLIERSSENLTTLDEHGKLKVFDSVRSIVKYFIDFRLKYYQLRKDYMIDQLQKEVLLLTNKANFIKGIIEDKIHVKKVQRDRIEAQLESLKFDKIDGNYGYLLRMPIYSLTKEIYDELMRNLKLKKDELKETKKLVPKDMYEKDLRELKRILRKDETYTAVYAHYAQSDVVFDMPETTTLGTLMNKKGITVVEENSFGIEVKSRAPKCLF